MLSRKRLLEIITRKMRESLRYRTTPEGYIRYTLLRRRRLVREIEKAAAEKREKARLRRQKNADEKALYEELKKKYDKPKKPRKAKKEDPEPQEPARYLDI